jgi:TonB family protein
MTRLQKKCFLFSAGMHGLLGIILLGSSAFRDKPAAREMVILTMIPPNILDRAGAGGGSLEPSVAPRPAQPVQPAQPAVQAPQPVAPQPVTPRPIAPPQPVEPVERTEPQKVEKEATQPALIPRKVVEKPTHEIHPTYDPVQPASNKQKPKVSETAVAQSSSQSAEARRFRRQIAESLDALATGVKSSGAQGTAVDMPGQGGGEAFAGYETIIYNRYFHAWITPEGVANKLAGADVKIVVARDGMIISAEIINKSGEPALDKSVERVLRAVTHLPPFPASSHDEQRSFLIRFNLEAKEGSG